MNDCGVNYVYGSLFSSSSCAIMKAARSNMLGAGPSNNKVKYSRLAADEDGYIDLQVRDLFFGNKPDMASDAVSCCSMDCSAVCVISKQFTTTSDSFELNPN